MKSIRGDADSDHRGDYEQRHFNGLAVTAIDPISALLAQEPSHYIFVREHEECFDRFPKRAGNLQS